MNLRVLVATGAAVTALASGGPRPVQAAETVDFTRFVAVGDSLTAGFASGSLFDGESGPPEMLHEGQREGFAVRLAAAMNTPATLPLIAYPGPAGFTLLHHTEGECKFSSNALALVPGTEVTRADPAAVPNILGVPGQSIADATSVKWSIDPANVAASVDSLEDLLLGFPAVTDGAAPDSQIGIAAAQSPTFVCFWLGSQDALAAATSADPVRLTPVADFDAAAEAAFAPLVATGAKGVVVNVPDVTAIPFLMTEKELREFLSEAAGQPVSDAAVRGFLGVRTRDRVPRTPNALNDVFSVLTGATAGPLPGADVLTAKEIAKIRATTKRYNRTLARHAKAAGWAYVDLNKVLRGIARRGLEVGDVHLTTGYLGGMFGMDTVHPTSTGNAVIATACIQAINKKYGTALPLPDLAAIVAVDPLAQCASGN